MRKTVQPRLRVYIYSRFPVQINIIIEFVENE